MREVPEPARLHPQADQQHLLQVHLRNGTPQRRGRATGDPRQVGNPSLIGAHDTTEFFFFFPPTVSSMTNLKWIIDVQNFHEKQCHYVTTRQ